METQHPLLVHQALVDGIQMLLLHLLHMTLLHLDTWRQHPQQICLPHEIRMRMARLQLRRRLQVHLQKHLVLITRRHLQHSAGMTTSHGTIKWQS